MTRRLVLILLFALLPFSADAQLRAAPQEGVDYTVIRNGKPWQPLNGKIEVVEVFAYWCHHCNDFQPYVDTWKKTLPKDVRFNYVAAAFNPNDAYARAFFAAETIGALAKTHNAMFRAIHVDRSLPSKGATVDEVAGFYAAHGYSAQQMAAAMRTPAVDAKMQRARQWEIDADISGTPSVIVNGKYLVHASTHQDTLRIASELIAIERTRKSRTGQAKPKP